MKKDKDKYEHRAIKYRIYPTEEQCVFFQKTFGCCRFIWNRMLGDRIDYYQKHKTSLYVTPAMYKEDYPWLKEVDSLALANVQMNLNKAYNRYYEDRKKKKKQAEKVSKPKFHSKKKSKQSYTTNNQNGTIEINFTSSRIKLPKVGWVKASLHRQFPDEWKLKNATVSQNKTGQYFVSICFEKEKEEKPVAVNTVIGLDYKSNGLYVDSDGHCADMPHCFRNNQKKLSKLQRQQAKKVGSRKGEEKSHNWLKQQQRINKLYQKSANQRKDFLHKKSTEIANRYDLVCVENLNMKALSNKGFKNGKATMDNGYGLFLEMLQYKQEARGHVLIKVDRFFPSSQTCSVCGCIHPITKDLSIRNWTCPDCGTEHDRDLNAAINIQKEGYRLYCESIA